MRLRLLRAIQLDQRDPALPDGAALLRAIQLDELDVLLPACQVRQFCEFHSTIAQTGCDLHLEVIQDLPDPVVRLRYLETEELDAVVTCDRRQRLEELQAQPPTLELIHDCERDFSAVRIRDQHVATDAGRNITDQGPHGHVLPMIDPRQVFELAPAEMVEPDPEPGKTALLGQTPQPLDEKGRVGWEDGPNMGKDATFQWHLDRSKRL